MSENVRAGLLFFGLSFVTGFVLTGLGVHGLTMNFTAMGVAAVVVYLYKMLAGNRDVRNGSDGDREEALRAVPPAGFGAMFVYRKAFIGMAIGMDVRLDGETVAQLKSPRFTRVFVPAGMHSLEVGLKGFAATQNKDGATTVQIHGGETLVYKVSSRMGAVQNAIVLTQEADSPAVRSMLGGLTYVVPEGTPSSSTTVSVLPTRI